VKINAGEKIAIVGNSGAGKSTLMDLLIGVLLPSEGVIGISGMTPIEAIKNWQGAIAYVPQSIALVEGSIAENIRLGFPREIISDEQVSRAIESAQLMDFVDSLPEGLETNIGENGSRLSGGQKQRIGIARALITNPKLVFMDEATSALDSETEEKISETIANLGSSITVILIAHRVTTIQHANKILYLESGTIKSFGTLEQVRKEVEAFESTMNKIKS
jgi:ABC-type multidrug transport system fused ATPase/permease subunit